MDVRREAARTEALQALLPMPVGIEGGARELCREDFLRAAKRELEEFFLSRHSVREFEQKEVPLDLLMQAVRLAQCAPSACNRQSGRVWVVSRPERVRGVLEIQGGAEGFVEQVPAVLVVTSDLACWQSVGEWYQAWIDGGLFAMTLVWSLHSLGLATCMLNWSKRKEVDLALRRYLGIPEQELVIVLVAAGFPPPKFRVAASPRLPLTRIVRVDRSGGIERRDSEEAPDERKGSSSLGRECGPIESSG